MNVSRLSVTTIRLRRLGYNRVICSPAAVVKVSVITLLPKLRDFRWLGTKRPFNDATDRRREKLFDPVTPDTVEDLNSGMDEQVAWPLTAMDGVGRDVEEAGLPSLGEST